MSAQRDGEEKLTSRRPRRRPNGRAAQRNWRICALLLLTENGAHAPVSSAERRAYFVGEEEAVMAPPMLTSVW